MEMILKKAHLPNISENLIYILLRSFLSIIFITHGLARLYYESVEDFGDFLNANGTILGVPLAYSITIGEILGGMLVLIGYKVKYVIVFHFIIIFFGIFLVHLEYGWFVVGHGRNGVEYSILILMVLLFIYRRESGKKV